MVILALLFWYFAGRNNDTGLNVGMDDMNDSTLVGTAPNTGAEYSAAGTVEGAAVGQYMQFVDARASRAAGVAHEYTADGLRQLAAALRELATGESVGGVDVQPRIDEIRERADAMQQNPTATEHALQTREAFARAASLIGQMRSTTSGETRTPRKRQRWLLNHRAPCLISPAKWSSSLPVLVAQCASCPAPCKRGG